MSAILQIGLHYNCEYLRLLPGYEDAKIDPMPLVFREFVLEHWTHYIGVDMNFECIDYHLDNPMYSDDLRVNFFRFLVHKTDGIEYKHQGFQVKQGEPDDIENYKYSAKSVSLNRVMDHIQPVCPVLLVLDVEGVEYDILQGYDFQNKPRYIIVEVHSHHNVQSIKDFMDTKGYHLVEFTRTGSPPTAEFPKPLIQNQMGFIDKAYLPEHSFYIK